MSTDGFAAFLEAMGHRVREEGGFRWFDAHPHVYMSFPFHKPVDVAAVDYRAVLGRDGWIARHACRPGQGRPSYILVCDEPEYNLSTLDGKARNQTRRGLENCVVRQIDFDDLVEHGPAINRETLERQGRRIPKGHDDYWRRYYRQAAHTEGAETWGAFVDGTLAAFLISFTMDQWANILIVRSSRAFLRQYPNNALFFRFLEATLARPDIHAVSIGLESVQRGMDTLDRFKTGMGFRKEPIDQRIELAPWINPGVARWIARHGPAMLRRFDSNELVGKLSGMLQWYSEQ